MNYLERAVRALRRMTWGAREQLGRWGGPVLWRAALPDLSRVDPAGSGAVMACLNWIARTMPEAPLRVMRMDETGRRVPVPAHRLTKLLGKPNPYYSGVTLWMATLSDFTLTGNAYWVKIRDGAGRVAQLWWVPEGRMTPCWNAPDYVSYYEYAPEGTDVYRIPPGEVVHFRWGLDPDNVRKGLSPLASVLREIFTDEEGAHFAAATLKNMGVPGVIIQPEDSETALTEDNAELIRQDFKHKFSGENRGSAMVLSDRVKVTTLTITPKDMDVAALRKIPESRICAVLGVPAMVVGLMVGLERSTYSNYSEAREAAFEQCIVPLQRLLAGELTLQLLRDFEDGSHVELEFDLSNIRVLQEDKNKQAQRLAVLVKAGIVTVGEARLELGMDEQLPEPALPVAA